MLRSGPGSGAGVSRGDEDASNPFRSVLKGLRHRLRTAWRCRRFAARLRHLHGPRRLESGPEEVILIALVRDGSYYLDAFFDHYRAMGIRHFVFIDNGSTDDTIERIKAESGTVIDQCDLPLGRYEDLIRGWPAMTYGRDRWCLYVDMDEMFDFEGREVLGIEGLVRYLDAGGYTALVAQMLEMFPKAPLSEVARLPYDAVLREFVYFDLSHVDRRAYHDPDIDFSGLLAQNSLSNPEVEVAFGGVRAKVFGEACCLTKHPLIFNGPGVVPGSHPHVSTGVHCADFTALIRHYKFANDPAGRDAASVARGDLAHGEDAVRVRRLSAEPDARLFSLDARRWNRIELLYRAGFLTGSVRFSDHAKRGTG